MFRRKKNSKIMLSIFLRKLPSYHGEVSVMENIRYKGKKDLNQVVITITKLLISHLIIAVGYQTWISK